ncbi:sugar phosphate isomerase/epimerase and 4-hydroxyphenylpyruvate domain-containing protein [Actinophytocola sp.]|uniref:sugar phosphate isomerase/epimerase and 4-hydroxyphenylpyruvate domain-containing protein n=1 Tax=Actinophytocola sp. TaxID=1872138 RepID=UPI002ED64017
MPNPLSIATVCLSGTLDDKLAAAASAGFDGVEIFENDLVGSSWSPKQIRERCADLGLSIDLYQPFRDFEAVPPDILEANLRRAERKLDLMAELGTDTMLVCSSVSPDAVDDDDLAAEQLHQLAERAAERGMRIAYEALAWGRFVNTYDHSWRIVRRAGHPALGLCLDSFHVLSRGSDPSGIRVIPGDKLFFLQLADAPRLRMDVLQWSRHHRLFPGQGAFDLTGFVQRVLGTGYAGPLSLEVFNDVFRQSDPGGTAVDAMRSLLVLKEKLGIGDLPAAPPLAGYALAEVASNDTGITDTLAALGFRATHRHGDESVQLWHQGDATLAVRTGATTRITTVGVASTAPEVLLQRAEHLLAVPAESGVVTPDGTTLTFTAELTDVDGEDNETDLLTGIDHVSLTAPFDVVDQTALFYRSVLGLESEPEAEFAAPFGLVRSLSASDGRVRIVHNVAMLRRGEWAPAVPDPQHIAFTTTDAIAAARAMRARGAPLLDIGDNYYDDLDARLAPPRLAELRECSVLYDRDEHGEYLHFYTHILGDRVFFEIVQRIGGYAGYGAVNSPVRMAAHRRERLNANDHRKFR